MGGTRCKSADGSPQGDSHVHVTTLAIIAIAAGCAEHLAIGYFTWKLAKRKGRMWLPYAIFGLLGYVVLALRAPAYNPVFSAIRNQPRSALTHTGFARPEDEIDDSAGSSRRGAPLAGYHLPPGVVAPRTR
jgi:hypothetical protein